MPGNCERRESGSPRRSSMSYTTSRSSSISTGGSMEPRSSLRSPCASPFVGEVPRGPGSHAGGHETSSRRRTMSTGDPAGGRDPWRKEQERTGWYGWIAFAGIMLIVLGLFHGLMGLLAIFEEEYYAVGDKGLMISVDYSAWGWVHLILGAVMVFAGFALTRGATWARIVAVVVAVLSALTNVAFMSAY